MNRVNSVVQKKNQRNFYIILKIVFAFSFKWGVTSLHLSTPKCPQTVQAQCCIEQHLKLTLECYVEQHLDLFLRLSDIPVWSQFGPSLVPLADRGWDRGMEQGKDPVEPSCQMSLVPVSLDGHEIVLENAIICIFKLKWF